MEHFFFQPISKDKQTQNQSGSSEQLWRNGAKEIIADCSFVWHVQDDHFTFLMVNVPLLWYSDFDLSTYAKQKKKKNSLQETKPTNGDFPATFLWRTTNNFRAQWKDII